MSEMTKTLTFAGVAVAVALVALLTGPSWRSVETEDVAGRPLSPDYKNAMDAASLEIVKFDEELREPQAFAVARRDNRWSIPSHADYPADAEGQLGKATASMLGLKILSVADDGQTTDNVREIHDQYGVIDPGSAKASDKSVGMKVTIKDKNDDLLTSLIIGKEVPDQAGLRWVRHVDKDPVYVVKVDTSELSTKFEDWIEDDLLQLSSLDIKQVDVHDYTVGFSGLSLVQDVTGQMKLEYDNSGDPNWKFLEDLVFDDQAKELAPVEMADDEELDTDKLNDLKSALDDLKIVDVQRKPAGLSANLKAPGSGGIDETAMISLQRRGFYLFPVQSGDKTYVELFANNGEIRVAMTDGVEYVLRFGEAAGLGSDDAEKKKDEDPKKENGEPTEEPEKKDDPDAEDKADGDDEPGLNRYLFVMAQFDPNMIRVPDYEKLPSENDSTPAETETPDDAKSDGEETKSDPADADAADADPAESDPVEADPVEADPAKSDPADADPAESDPVDAEKTGAEKTEGESAGGDASDGNVDEGRDGDQAQDEEKKAEELKAERERIETDNQRKKDDYDKKLEEGQKKVRQLNARFADWYYIISGDVYKKIHLSRDQIVKKKEKEDENKDADNGDAGKADDDPAESDPAESDPAESDPAESDPAKSDPAESDPAKSDPAESDPAESDPADHDHADDSGKKKEPAGPPDESDNLEQEGPDSQE